MKFELENALKAGSWLAEFRILEVLGAGGFGITYKAYDKHLDDYVAIKEFFPAEYAVRRGDSTTVKARSNKDWDYFQYGLDAFRKEAKTLARFAEHPNIVTVRRYLEAHETAYLVMHYEEGQTLAQWLRAYPQPTEDDLREIFIPALDGLREVHNRHYLHRDIKPGNIYIRHDGRPLLIDFGSARQALGDRSQSLSIILSEGYAAKEQYSRKGNQGAWTDIYGIGATLWRAVSGQDPPSAADRSEARDEGQPDPLRPAVEIGRGRYSENLLQAIDWALAYLPAERPQTVRELQQKLLAPPPVAITIPPKPIFEKAGDVTGSSSSKAENSSTDGEIPNPSIVKAGPAEPFLKKADDVNSLSSSKAENISTDDEIPKGKGLRQTLFWLAVLAIPLIIGGIESRKSPPSIPPAEPVFFEPEMVRIKAGCFQMGSPTNEPERYDNERQHKVCIQPDYEIGKYEVTQGQWRAVMGNNPSEFKKGDDYPVENVSWNDIQGYLTKLKQKTEKNYRLPTEAEWEYAARGGTTTAFWTGRCITTAQANYDGNHGYGSPDCGANTGIFQQKTQAVGSYSANPWGLYDTLGNVWEWTCSYYDKYYDGFELKCSENDTNRPRVLRGGSWGNVPSGVRSANRSWDGPANGNNTNRGFRLARSL